MISALTNISAFNESERWAHVNLTDAYHTLRSRGGGGGREGGAVSAYTRGFALDSDYKTLVITDSFTPRVEAGLINVSWAMHTKAQIAVVRFLD